MVDTTGGNYQLIYSDASGTRRDVVWGPVRSEMLNVSTDPRQKVQVDMNTGDPLRENDKFILSAKTDSADNLNNTSIILVPVTIKNMKTGVERATFLTAADFGFTASNVATSATQFNDMGVYTVNAQEAMKLGHVNPLNSVIYIYGKHA